MAAIVRCEIHPALGIARVGDSPDEYFLAPEVPGCTRTPDGGYKDAAGRIKRQVQRFRVYGYDGDGNVVRELTSRDADIEWRVHVANSKGAWYVFDRAMDVPDEASQARRNAEYTSDRTGLVIDPGPRVVVGPGKRAALDGGTFMGEAVSLGEIRTDDDGRLLFFGGRGRSEGVGDPTPEITTLNNPGWFDDVSDGPVDAKVVIDGTEIPVEGAWVVVGPPDYAPGVLGPITMYDVVLDTASRAGWIPAPECPSFTEDILPILSGLCDLQWVNAGMNLHHGWGSREHFTAPSFLKTLSSAAPSEASDRQQVFERFRNPYDPSADATLLPPMYGDGICQDLNETGPMKWLTVTCYQYDLLKRWAEGSFIADHAPRDRTSEDVDHLDDPRPMATTRAALERCEGGPFHPGCEVTWIMRRTLLYSGAFRVKRRKNDEPLPDYGEQLTAEVALSEGGPLDGSGPGDLTRWMAVPWQIDTASCGAGYDARLNAYLPTLWPATVPNHVISERMYERIMDGESPLSQRQKFLNSREDWLRDFSSSEGFVKRGVAFVGSWSEVGIVVPSPSPKGAHLPPEIQVERGNSFETSFDARVHRVYADVEISQAPETGDDP